MKNKFILISLPALFLASCGGGGVSKVDSSSIPGGNTSIPGLDTSIPGFDTSATSGGVTSAQGDSSREAVDPNKISKEAFNAEFNPENIIFERNYAIAIRMDNFNVDAEFDYGKIAYKTAYGNQYFAVDRNNSSYAIFKYLETNGQVRSSGLEKFVDVTQFYKTALPEVYNYLSMFAYDGLTYNETSKQYEASNVTIATPAGSIVIDSVVVRANNNHITYIYAKAAQLGELELTFSKFGEISVYLPNDTIRSSYTPYMTTKDVFTTEIDLDHIVFNSNYKVEMTYPNTSYISSLDNGKVYLERPNSSTDLIWHAYKDGRGTCTIDGWSFDKQTKEYSILNSRYNVTLTETYAFFLSNAAYVLPLLNYDTNLYFNRLGYTYEAYGLEVNPLGVPVVGAKVQVLDNKPMSFFVDLGEGNTITGVMSEHGKISVSLPDVH